MVKSLLKNLPPAKPPLDLKNLLCVEEKTKKLPIVGSKKIKFRVRLLLGHSGQPSLVEVIEHGGVHGRVQKNDGLGFRNFCLQIGIQGFRIETITLYGGSVKKMRFSSHPENKITDDFNFSWRKLVFPSLSLSLSSHIPPNIRIKFRMVNLTFRLPPTVTRRGSGSIIPDPGKIRIKSSPANPLAQTTVRVK
jgi:hypothetical protein